MKLNTQKQKLVSVFREVSDGSAFLSLAFSDCAKFTERAFR